MVVTTPRWLQRLDAAVAQAETPLARECAKADRAVRLARMGRTQDARFTLGGLRSQQQRLRAPLLEARIVFLTGMIEHFTSLSVEAGELFAQARDLAQQAGDEALATQASAWTAQCLLNASDLDGMAEQLRVVLARVSADDHASWARLALVLCVAFDYAGDPVASQRWATLARQHASQDDDSSMISAVLYNMSSLRAGRIAFDDAWGHANPEEARRALMEIESTGHYDFGAGSSGLTALVPTMRALLLAVLTRWDEASVLLERHMTAIREQGHARIAARYLAVWAWCEVNLGNIDRARRMAHRAQEELAAQDAMEDPHTHAAASARLSSVMARCDRPEEAQTLRQEAETALQEWHRYQQRMQRVLAGLDLPN